MKLKKEGNIVVISYAQLKSVVDMANDMSAMIGGGDECVDLAWKKNVKNIDAFLKQNNLPKRSFS